MMAVATEAQTEKDLTEKVIGEKACAVCRTERPKGLLLRFVRDANDKLVFDVRQRAPGRGVSVCIRSSCLKKLKGTSPPLFERVSEALGAHVLNAFGLIRRQNRLILGADSVSKMLQIDGGSCAFVSAESAERTQKDVRQAAEKSEESRGLRVIAIPASQEVMGKATGRDVVGVLGIDAATLARGMCSGLKEKALLWAELNPSKSSGKRSANKEEGRNG